MHSRIEPEDALRILKEETPRRIRRLRKELQNLKEHIRERGQSARESDSASKRHAA
jgi:hypothetical protein